MMRRAFCVIACLSPFPAMAEFAAHQHGVAGMNIGVEGKDVHITFTPTGHDVLGFEYQPRTNEEKAAAKAVKVALEDGLTLFGVPKAADCRVEYAEVNSGLFHFDEDDDHKEKAVHKEEDHNHKHDAHKRDDKDHAEHAHDEKAHDGDAHKDEAHDKDAHDTDAHDTDAHDDQAHDDVLAKYHFVCENPQALDGLDMTYFATFPKAETVNVNAITDAGQFSVKLTRAAPHLDLRRD